MSIEELKDDPIGGKSITYEDEVCDIKFHYNYFQTLALYYALKKKKKVSPSSKQNLVLQITSNLPIEVKSELKINILLLINFLNEGDKLLKSRNQILWIKQLNLRGFQI